MNHTSSTFQPGGKERRLRRETDEAAFSRPTGALISDDWNAAALGCNAGSSGVTALVIPRTRPMTAFRQRPEAEHL
ncbi:MAG: hypothetical protein ABL999_07155 [Pyrinomonadaceae bacterium]